MRRSYARGDYRDKWRIERRAAEVRGALGLDQIQVLDPVLLADSLGAEVFDLADLIDDEVELRRARDIAFDGMASTHPSEEVPIIVLNCGRPVRRRTATLMEELGHLVLGHQPSRIYLANCSASSVVPMTGPRRKRPTTSAPRYFCPRSASSET